MYNVEILSNGIVKGDIFCNIAYAGEVNSRKVKVVHPVFEDCIYGLLFRVQRVTLYSKLDDNNECILDRMLLARDRRIRVQFVAKDRLTQDFIFKSKPWEWIIHCSLDDMTGEPPIPVYEEALGLYSKMINAEIVNKSKMDKITEFTEGNIARISSDGQVEDSGLQLITEGELTSDSVGIPTANVIYNTIVKMVNNISGL